MKMQSEERNNKLTRFILTLFFFIEFVSVINCGKLNLNNPGDSLSKTFFETVLFRYLTRPIAPPITCTTSSRWEKSFGSGTYKTVVDEFVTLENEDILIAGFTNESLGVGKNYNFIGTTGTTINGFVMRLDGSDGSIKWLDYIGQIDGDIGIRLLRFSNGEILLTYLAYTEIVGSISPTVNLGSSIPSFALARMDQNGNRKWHTYFDSTDIASANIAVIDSNDQIHILTKLNGANGHQSFIEFPAATNTANGSTGDTDILYGVVSSAGIPKSQMYISGTGGDVPAAMVRIGSDIYIAGDSSENVNGFSGHPSPGFERVFVLKANENQTISWLNYRGPTSAVTTGTVTDFKTDGNDLFLLGRTNDGFGTPVSAYQGTSNKNYYFQKINTSGVTQWLTFLGHSTVTITEGIRIPILSPAYRPFLHSTLLAPNSNNRYTGLGAAETGDGTGSLQRVTTKINTITGAYEKVVFETNDTAPQKTHYTILSEVCVGKLFRGERVLPDIGDSNRLSFKIKVFPTSELP
jgi:hypothetical protein